MTGVGPWVVRVASRPEVGGGHVSRCRALALELKGTSDVTFVLDRGGSAWARRLRSDGFAVREAGDEPPLPWIGCVVDGYDFAVEYLETWSGRAGPMVYMDDMLTLPSQAGVVVNPGVHLSGREIRDRIALLGPEYALLNSSYRDVPRRAVERRVGNVLVTMGLRDSAGATLLALRSLERLGRDGFRPKITVLLGRDGPHTEAVRRETERFNGRAELRLDDGDVPGRLKRTDLVVGAGGVALLERLACGVPSVSVVVAANQLPSLEGAARLGATVCAGDVETLTGETLAARIGELGESHDKRADMSRISRELVDGRGALRVSQALNGAARRDDARRSV